MKDRRELAWNWAAFSRNMNTNLRGSGECLDIARLLLEFEGSA